MRGRKGGFTCILGEVVPRCPLVPTASPCGPGPGVLLGNTPVGLPLPLVEGSSSCLNRPESSM